MCFEYLKLRNSKNQYRLRVGLCQIWETPAAKARSHKGYTTGGAMRGFPSGVSMVKLTGLAVVGRDVIEYKTSIVLNSESI